MKLTRDISANIVHPYFRETEQRYEKGSGLDLALHKMAARKAKSEALRVARLAMIAEQTLSN